VVDFGAGRGIYTYDGLWDWLSNKDGVNAMAVWDNNLVIDFGGGRGLQYYDTAWHLLSIPDDVAWMVPWNNGSDLAVDFGGASGRMYNYNGTWNWIRNDSNVPEMTAWTDGLAVDFGTGVGIYNYNGTWNMMKTWSTAD